MGDLHVVGGVKKLYNQNYNMWATCMESYLQGWDLRKVIGGDEVALPESDDAALKKWKLKVGKSMFANKTTIEEEMLEHIECGDSQRSIKHVQGNILKEETISQLLKNKLSIAQRDMTINQFF